METMVFNNEERRRVPRVLIDLPLEYRDRGDSPLRGAIVVNVGEGGFLIESTRVIPVGTELNITVLFPKGFELAGFKAVAKIIWREPYQKDLEENQSWEGYRYGLKLIQIQGDIAKLLGEIQKEFIGFDELLECASQSLQDDYVKCIFCGREKSEHEMQKVFYKKHKGICKNCFKLEVEE